MDSERVKLRNIHDGSFMDNTLSYGTKIIEQTSICKRESTSSTCSTTDLLPDPYDENEKLPYPKSVFFIIINEFCERFSYYGMKAVLTIYLANELKNISEDNATVIYHIFSMFCYFTCIFGAMLADSFLGKFRTIFYLSIVYAAGNILLSLAATKPLHLPINEFSFTGLALIAIGTGGIKPCVAAFGGDQFKMPQQEKQLTTFFSVFYFSINAGSLISTFITPIFRKDITCFEQDTCYPLAFAVPAVLFIVALIVFVCGKPFYIIKPSEGNVVVMVSKCISHAVRRKFASDEKREHWLDNAEDKYPKTLIEDIKIVLRVLFLYLPLPIFWALFDQQGSRWTLQATKMDGELFGVTIKPDQMQVINPFLILAFIPLFDQGIYPLLAKCNILKRPLQRLTVGGLLAAVAFIISGLLELKLETTYAIKLTPEQMNLNFVNTLPCNITLTIPNVQEDRLIAQYENAIFSQINATNYNVKISPDVKHPACSSSTYKEFTYELKEEPGKAFTYLIGFDAKEGSKNSIKVFRSKDADDLTKSRKEGKPRIRLLHTGLLETTQWGEDSNSSIQMTSSNIKIPTVNISINSNDTTPIDIDSTTYNVKIKSEVNNQTVDLGDYKFKLGGVYVFTVTKNFAEINSFTGNNSYRAQTYVITEPNSVHMLWLLPQYIIMTVGEIMFSITGLEFSYNQAPTSMKSVMQSAWLLTVAFGNLIVVIIAEAKLFEEQSKEFFLFAALMVIDMVLFSIMAYFYKPAVHNNNDNEMTVQNEKNEESK